MMISFFDTPYQYMILTPESIKSFLNNGIILNFCPLSHIQLHLHFHPFDYSKYTASLFFFCERRPDNFNSAASTNHPYT